MFSHGQRVASAGCLCIALDPCWAVMASSGSSWKLWRWQQRLVEIKSTGALQSGNWNNAVATGELLVIIGYGSSFHIAVCKIRRYCYFYCIVERIICPLMHTSSPSSPSERAPPWLCIIWQTHIRGCLNFSLIFTFGCQSNLTHNIIN